jgi:hypothetical protein
MSYAGPIDDKYAGLHGPNGPLGPAVSQERTTAEGHRVRSFRHGVIYWTPNAGAHAVYGAIFQKWTSLGGTKSPVGYPITDELDNGDGRGRHNDFTSGMIYWSPQTGASAVYGAIGEKWIALGKTMGLGYPLTDEMDVPDRRGRMNRFERGNIFWRPEVGAYLGSYRVVLDNMRIMRTRSRHEDTDHASLRVKIGDQIYGPVSKKIGDVNDGRHRIGLEIGPVFVRDLRTPMDITYEVINAGHHNPGDLERILRTGHDTLVTLIPGSSLPGVSHALSWITSLLFANCDGLVAVGHMALNAHDLRHQTGATGTFTEVKFHPGLESPWGCGANSKYETSTSVSKIE